MTPARQKVNKYRVRNSAEHASHGALLDRSTLRRLCWQSGFHGVSGLARALGRNRVTLYAAVRWPGQYAPTYRKIRNALGLL